MDWPAEPMWQAVDGRWVPDWRRECLLLEHALHGAPLDPNVLSSFVSTPANQLPKDAQDRNGVNPEIQRVFFPRVATGSYS